MDSTKFIVDKNDLQKHLQKVCGAVNGKNTLPIYDNILCELQGEKLTLTGSDTTIQVETSLNVMQPECDSKFCFDRTVLDTLKTLPSQPITLEVNANNNSASLQHASGDFNFAVLDGEEYKKMAWSEDSGFAMPTDRLKMALEFNVRQVAYDELRPVMNGIFVDIEKDKITFVASDGHRLSKFVDSSIKDVDLKPFNLPKKAADLLLKYISSGDNEDAFISSTEKSACVVIGPTTLTARLIEGRYPNYNSVIPQNNTIKLTASKKELMSIIDRLSIASDSATGLIKLEAKGEKVLFSSEDRNYNKSGKEAAEMDCTGDITIGFKGTFMRDLLLALPEDIEISFSDSNRAMLIVPAEQEDEVTLTMILMPLMLND